MKDYRTTSSFVNSESNTVIAATCGRCGRMRSRRGGFELSERQRFLCAPCLGELEAEVERDFARAAYLWGGAA